MKRTLSKDDAKKFIEYLTTDDSYEETSPKGDIVKVSSSASQLEIYFTFSDIRRTPDSVEIYCACDEEWDLLRKEYRAWETDQHLST